MKKTIDNPWGFIYLTTNMINGKKYIGQRRFSKGWENYLGSGVIFKRAVKKYSKDNFSREIIAIAYSKEELDRLEIMFIKKHGAVYSNDYYNLTKGGKNGVSGFHFSEESKKKLSKLQKNNKHNLGHHHSEESKQKIREGNIGKIISIETRKKLSESNRRRKGLIKYSEETKRKLSESHLRLTTMQAEEVRNKYAIGDFTLKKLSEKYNCAYGVIHNIINHKHGY